MHRVFVQRVFLTALMACLAVVLGIGLVACGSGVETGAVTADPASTQPSSGPSTDGAASLSGGEVQELTVSAASSLTAAFTDIAAAFDEANDCETTLNFDSSGSLQKQIEAGAPVDVFASAAPKQMNNLLEEELVEQASIQTFARNEIILAVPADSTLGLTSFEDLTKTEVEKIAYGDPVSVPHGTYAEETLTTLGILDQIKPKVIYTKNVSQTLTYITSGEVDAGIMFATDGVAGGDNVKVIATADPSWHSEVSYPIGTVSASEKKTLAQKFIDFVMSAEGQALLQKHGFVAP